MKPVSYFLRMRMRYECWRHKFATNYSQFNFAQLTWECRCERRVVTSNSLCIRIRRKYEPGLKLCSSDQVHGSLYPLLCYCKRHAWSAFNNWNKRVLYVRQCRSITQFQRLLSCHGYLSGLSNLWYLESHEWQMQTHTHTGTQQKTTEQKKKTKRKKVIHQWKRTYRMSDQSCKIITANKKGKLQFKTFHVVKESKLQNIFNGLMFQF